MPQFAANDVRKFPLVAFLDISLALVRICFLMRVEHVRYDAPSHTSGHTCVVPKKRAQKSSSPILCSPSYSRARGILCLYLKRLDHGRKRVPPLCSDPSRVDCYIPTVSDPPPRRLPGSCDVQNLEDVAGIRRISWQITSLL